MNGEFFIWDGSPEMVQWGGIPLPFAISIPGLLLAVLLFLIIPAYFSPGKVGPGESNTRRRSRKKREAVSGESKTEWSGWQSAGLLAGLLIVGQLLFRLLPGPEFQQIGPITLRWYGVLFASAFLIGYLIGRKLFKDAGKDIQLADKLLTYIVLATIAGARLGHVIFYELDYYLRNLHEILYVWQGGLASHGATIGILLALWLFMRNHPGITFFWLTDRLSIPVILGGAFIRMGNFFNSEIYGLPTEWPWAIIFARIDTLPRHPTMLYEALICLVILVILLLIYHGYKKFPPEGLLTGVFMITLFTSRFFVEYTKVEQAAFTETWLIGMGQLLSIPFVLFGIWILWKKVPFRTHMPGSH